MLQIDDVHARAGAQRAHDKRREQVGLASPRVAEDRDICVCVPALVEWVDQDRRSGRGIASNEKTTSLLKVRLIPRKERDQGGRVDDPLTLQRVGTAGLRCQETVTHPKSAG